MSYLTLRGNTSGTGDVTLQAPNTNTPRTLTLPDADGTVSIDTQVVQKSGDTMTGPLNVPSLASTGDVSGSSFNSLPVTISNTMGKNFLINPSLIINQRGFSSGTGGYCVDRWAIGSALSCVFAQSDLPGLLYPSGAKLTIGRNTVGTSYILQRIEAYNSAYLAGKQVTVSAWIKVNSGDAQNVNFDISSASVRDNFASVVDAVSANIAVIAGGAWNRYSATITVPASGINGIQLQVGATCLTNLSFDVTGIQLELGDKATEFEMRDFATELKTCKRYYEKSFSYDVVPSNGSSATGFTDAGATVCAWSTNTAWMAFIPFEVEKRTTPTVTVYGNNVGYWNSDNGWSSNVSVLTASPKGLLSAQQVFAGYQGVRGHYTASAEL